ncbi:MAG: hypothetical protein IPG86_13245 [Chitinophagaceae bacterium]|nr:hypothetical protein [Chitinophagaceae bacterium]
MNRKISIRIVKYFCSLILIFSIQSLAAQECKTMLAEARKMIQEANCKKVDPTTWANKFGEIVKNMAMKQCNDEVAILLNYQNEVKANPKLVECDNNPKCSKLVYYRDVTLLKQYTDALSKLEISQNSLELITKIRKELLDETRWVTSDMGRAVATLSQYLKLQCNLINNIVGAAIPPLKGRAALAKFTFDFLANLIENDYDFSATISDQINDKALEMVLEKFGPAGSAISTIKDLAEDINTIKVNEDEFRTLRKEIDTKMGIIEKEIRKYNAEIPALSKNFSKIKSIKDVIDQYLDKNCKKTTAQRLN